MAISQVRAKIQGQWHTLTYNETTRNYEAYITPTATSYNQPGGYFVAEVEALTDSGGMDTASGEYRQGLRLYVKETTSPVITLISPPEGYLTVNSPVITAQAQDETGGSGIDPDSVRAYIDGQVVPCSIVKAGEAYSITVQANALGEGTHIVAVNIRDNDGNEAATLTVMYFVDTIAPEFMLISPPEGFISTNRPIFTFTAVDSGSGVDIDSLELWLDGTKQTAWISLDGNSVSFTPPTDLSEGTHTITVSVRDVAGNMGELTVEHFVDTIAPVVTLVSPSEGYLTDNLSSFVMAASDSGSGLDDGTLELWLDGVKQTSGISINDSTITFTPGEILPDGTHTISVSINDRAGNTGNLSVNYTVDTLPPELSIVLPGDERVVVDDETVIVAGYAFDHTSPPVVVTVGGVVTEVDETGFFRREVPLEVGANLIPVTVTDAAGLESSSVLYRIRLITDRTARDVEELKSQLRRFAEWTDEEKREFYQARHLGAYNHTDMNRVGLAAEYIAAQLTERGYITDVDGKQNWTMADIPTKSQTARYLADITSIKAVLPCIPYSPPKDMERFTFDQANDIEAVLVQADALRPLMDRSYIVCGEAVCGEF